MKNILPLSFIKEKWDLSEVDTEVSKLKLSEFLEKSKQNDTWFSPDRYAELTCVGECKASDVKKEIEEREKIIFNK